MLHAIILQLHMLHATPKWLHATFFSCIRQVAKDNFSSSGCSGFGEVQSTHFNLGGSA